MKVKELVEILSKMDPETELSLYCGGEDYYEDHPIGGIEYATDDGEIVFDIGDAGKYGIAREVDMEDFVNALDCLGFDWGALSYDQQKQLLDEFQNKLAEDDVYNQCYNEDLCEILQAKFPDLYNN